MTPIGPQGSGNRAGEMQRPWWGLGDVALGIVAAQFLSAFAFLVVFGATGWDSADDVPLWAGALLQIPLWVGLGGTTLWATRHKGLGPSQDFGLSFRLLDAPIGLAIGISCQLLLLPLIYWPVLRLLDRTTDELSEPARELADRAGDPIGWVVLFAMVAIGAPLVEELFYRGLLLRSLDKRGLPSWVSVVGSAALFGVMHFQLLQFLGLFVFGVVLAVMVRVSGRLGPSIWAHAGFNGATVILLYAGR